MAIVHNGIIENFKELRAEVAAQGRTFQSETDSEVVAHLISARIEAGDTPEEAARAVLPRLRGAFALAVTFRQHPDLLIGARLGSPLVVGHGEGEMFLGSDALALASLTQRITYLEEGDWVVIRRDRAQVYDSEGRETFRPFQHSGASAAAVEKGNYRHFMQKEIFEQPTVVAQTLSSYLRRDDNSVALPQFDFDLSGVKRLTIVACGTSFYAGMVAKYWFEQFARVPVDIDVASEFRYREPVLEEGGLALFISQSGETADTLAALRHCKAEGQVIGVVVNVPTSSMAREADLLLPTHAGPEIGVASTKAFSCQLAVLAALAANMETAVNALWDAPPRLGDRIAVVGCGVVGLSVAALAARMPGCVVEAIDPDPSRRARAERLGAIAVPPEDATPDADLVVHASASEAGLATALSCARVEGTVLELSWYGDRAPRAPLGEAFHPRRLKLISSQVGRLAPEQAVRWTHADRAAFALSLLADPDFDAIWEDAGAFADLPASMARIAEGGGPPAPLIRYDEEE